MSRLKALVFLTSARLACLTLSLLTPISETKVFKIVSARGFA